MTDYRLAVAGLTIIMVFVISIVMAVYSGEWRYLIPALFCYFIFAR